MTVLPLFINHRARNQPKRSSFATRPNPTQQPDPWTDPAHVQLRLETGLTSDAPTYRLIEVHRRPDAMRSALYHQRPARYVYVFLYHTEKHLERHTEPCRGIIIVFYGCCLSGPFTNVISPPETKKRNHIKRRLKTSFLERPILYAAKRLCIQLYPITLSAL